MLESGLDFVYQHVRPTYFRDTFRCQNLDHLLCTECAFRIKLDSKAGAKYVPQDLINERWDEARVGVGQLALGLIHVPCYALRCGCCGPNLVQILDHVECQN